MIEILQAFSYYYKVSGSSIKFGSNTNYSSIILKFNKWLEDKYQILFLYKKTSDTFIVNFISVDFIFEYCLSFEESLDLLVDEIRKVTDPNVILNLQYLLLNPSLYNSTLLNNEFKKAMANLVAELTFKSYSRCIYHDYILKFIDPVLNVNLDINVLITDIEYFLSIKDYDEAYLYMEKLSAYSSYELHPILRERMYNLAIQLLSKKKDLEYVWSLYKILSQFDIYDDKLIKKEAKFMIKLLERNSL